MNKKREQGAFIKIEKRNLKELKIIVAVLKAKGYKEDGNLKSIIDLDSHNVPVVYSQKMVKYEKKEDK